MVICLEIAIKGSMLYCIRVLLPVSTLGFQGDFMPLSFTWFGLTFEG